MRYLLISAAAVMAITGAAAIGNAQGNDRGKEPSAEGKGPGSGGGEKMQQPSQKRASEPGKGAQRENGKDQPRAAQQDRGDQQRKSSQGSDMGKDRAAQQRDGDKQKSTAQDRQRDQDKQKSAKDRQRDQDKQKSAQDRKHDQDKQKSAQDRQRDQDKQKSAKDRQRDQDKQKSAQGKEQSGRVQISEEKRSGVRERFHKEGFHVDKVSRSTLHVSINVGSRIPRSVRLHTLPVSIVSFAPAYRGYSYIVLEDETICVVDPRTYVIVDVIPAGTQRAERSGGSARVHLTLSREDMRFIRERLPKGHSANVNVRLALGAEVPRSVELLSFPEEIVTRVPDVRRYRYIVTENDIVIVDPDQRDVALVINE